jgi:triosephosphate isomerase (TIM)
MLVAGNWKMNTDLIAARQLAVDVVDAVGDPGNVRVVVCPPFISLHTVSEVVRTAPVDLGAQNMHGENFGAFTGEISGPMLRSVGCRFVILGHSERRHFFGETDEGINQKLEQALAHDLIPIVCVGETLQERKSGREEEVVQDQMDQCFAGVSITDADAIMVAYEPVWAIGTGETATPAQAQAMHALIRRKLVRQYGADVGQGMHILYGGSVKPENASELFDEKDVDGGLIGGASLKAEDFAAIVHAAR